MNTTDFACAPGWVEFARDALDVGFDCFAARRGLPQDHPLLPVAMDAPSILGASVPGFEVADCILATLIRMNELAERSC